jgi:hypothetical protein
LFLSPKTSKYPLIGSFPRRSFKEMKKIEKWFAIEIDIHWDSYLLHLSWGYNHYGRHFTCSDLSSRLHSLRGQEEWEEKDIRVVLFVIRKQRNVGIGYIFISSEREIDLNCPVILLTVEDDSPVFPVKCGVHVYFIEVIFVRNAVLNQNKEISLTNFAVGSDSGDCLLNFRISLTWPITVLLFASSYPFPASINKISQRNQVDITVAW